MSLYLFLDGLRVAAWVEKTAESLSCILSSTYTRYEEKETINQ